MGRFIVINLIILVLLIYAFGYAIRLPTRRTRRLEPLKDFRAGFALLLASSLISLISGWLVNEYRWLVQGVRPLDAASFDVAVVVGIVSILATGVAVIVAIPTLRRMFGQRSTDDLTGAQVDKVLKQQGELLDQNKEIIKQQAEELERQGKMLEELGHLGERVEQVEEHPQRPAGG